MVAQTQDGTDPGTAALSPLHLASLESDSVGDFRSELSREGACLVSTPKALESPGFDPSTEQRSDVVAHACNSSIPEEIQEDQEFTVVLTR